MYFPLVEMIRVVVATLSPPQTPSFFPSPFDFNSENSPIHFSLQEHQKEVLTPLPLAEGVRDDEIEEALTPVEERDSANAPTGATGATGATGSTGPNNQDPQEENGERDNDIDSVLMEGVVLTIRE